jgi:Leucine-rich repeat (LRR) protein
MTMLKTLFLDENHITGTLSTKIGNLINLEKLTLNRNELVGSIPNEIGKLANLSM